jgi:hypothetical protein
MVLDCCAGRIDTETVPASPGDLRSDWPGAKTAAAIRADIIQEGFDACGAEGAFKRANAGLERIGRKRLVALLAVRSQRERLHHVKVLVGKAVFPSDIFF